MRAEKPANSVRRARRLRREMTKPEAMLWARLRGSPGGHKFRKQHPAGPYNLDFFCAKANLAIEIDGMAHDMGDRPERDVQRDAWLRERRIDSLRIPAKDVLADADGVTAAVIAIVSDRLSQFAKAPPSHPSPSTGDEEKVT